MQFEWDPEKAAANARKHGISFEEARAVWDDPSAVRVLSRARPEERYLMIGRAWGTLVAVVVTVVFTYRGEDGETVRVISARRATGREADIYAAGD